MHLEEKGSRLPEEEEEEEEEEDEEEEELEIPLNENNGVGGGNCDSDSHSLPSCLLTFEIANALEIVTGLSQFEFYLIFDDDSIRFNIFNV